jgi:hypothetical protein
MGPHNSYCRKENEPAYFRPAKRPFSSLTNEELQVLFEFRCSKVKLDPKGFWDDVRSVYWGEMIDKLHDLYELMLEIQSRYPKVEVIGKSGSNFDKMLPLDEAEWVLLNAKKYEKKSK